ncbi:MAG: CubicO group peptidase (beta-lactamase class C family) [Glaciecola sp.]|jgi:CubicO group peptidase (beta-lactamase class C family)
MHKFTYLVLPLVVFLISSCTSNRLINHSEYKSASMTSANPLSLTQGFKGSLENEQKFTFTLNASEDHFVFGQVDQVDANLKINVSGPSGDDLFHVDTTQIGPEYFSFDTKQAGVYLIEVSLVKEKSQTPFTFELLSLEPVAKKPEDRVTQLLAEYDNDQTPGAVVGIIENGKVTFEKSVGMANLSYGIPMRTDMPTNLGSVSKQFTAMAILLLEKENKLSLDDDIRKHIPEIPDLGHTITIKHLLNHTNGLREMYNILAMRGYGFEDYLDRQIVIELVRRQPKLQANPGDTFNYNNTAFALLTHIAERVSKQAYPDWMRENVFEPLGMDNTYVRRDPGDIIPQASQGYELDENGYRESGDLYAAYGAGGIYTTVEDIGIWMKNYDTAQLGGKSLIEKLTTPTILNNGEVEDYGLGIGISEYRGQKVFRHGGADNAHRTNFIYFPELDKGMFISSNNAYFNDKSYQIIDAFFAEKLADKEEKELAKDDQVIALSDAQLEKLVGNFKSDKVGVNFTVLKEDGQLKLKFDETNILPLQAISESRFLTSDGRFDLQFVSKNSLVTNVDVTINNSIYEFVKIKDYQPTIEDLSAFQGVYYSSELDVVYRLLVEDENKLMLKVYGRPALALKPTEQDTFYGDGFFFSNIKFIREDSGTVNTLEVSNGRTQGVMFKRM